MTANMPADLLSLVRDHLHLPLSGQIEQAIGRLQGLRVGSLRFFGQAKEVVDDLHPSVPIQVLPLGTIRGHRCFGLHLTERGVARGAPAVVALWRHGRYPLNVIETANDLADFVLRALIDLEIEGEHDMLGPAVALAESAFGGGFHQPGRVDLAGAGDGGQVLHRLGRTPVDHYNEAIKWADDEEEERALLAEGTERHPDSLHLHALMTRLLDKRGEPAGAARHAVASLACYHHTSLHESIDLDEHYQRCASLAERVPDAFPREVVETIALRSCDDRARMQHTMGLFTRGEVRAAEKTLADMCWDFQDYSNELIVKVLARHYDVLGWRWAQALCDLRALVV